MKRKNLNQIVMKMKQKSKLIQSNHERKNENVRKAM